MLLGLPVVASPHAIPLPSTLSSTGTIGAAEATPENPSRGGGLFCALAYGLVLFVLALVFVFVLFKVVSKENKVVNGDFSGRGANSLWWVSLDPLFSVLSAIT